MKRLLLYVLLACATASATLAQDRLCAVMPQAVRARLSATEAADTLQLPFFDDFSQPNATAASGARWMPSAVYVNNDYALNPPTAGVASFDALDASGRMYAHLGAQAEGADTLCSLPIRLNAADTGVYLSFAYQPKGASDDIPELSDILALQLLAQDGTWITAWTAAVDTFQSEFTLVLKERYFLQMPDTRVATGDSVNDVTTFFTKVMLHVNDPKFLHPAFQLRFIGYASRMASDVEGRSGNSDIWNLDLVYLNRNRTAADTMLTDVAIAKPVMRLLKDYQAMPWQHLRESPTAQREQLVNATGSGAGIRFDVTNLARSSTAFYTNFTVQCTKGGTSESVKSYPGGTNNIQRDTTRSYTFSLPANDFLKTPRPEADSVEFCISAVISNYAIDAQLAQTLACNDTTRYYQRLFDYYSYDDGTSENGFGIFGASAINSRAALRYVAYKRDTLSGVYIYFNSTADSSNFRNVLFKLVVWGDDNGQPGQELIAVPNLAPRFEGLNTPVFYALTRPVVVEGAFYVGWAQQSPVMLNVGFDRNNRPQGKMFVSQNGYSWNLSKYDGQGVLMVRPSFLRIKYEQPSGIATPAPVAPLRVFPNPTSGAITVEHADMANISACRLRVVALAGATLGEYRLSAGGATALNLSSLPQGIYFVVLVRGNSIVRSAKIVVRD